MLRSAIFLITKLLLRLYVRVHLKSDVMYTVFHLCCEKGEYLSNITKQFLDETPITDKYAILKLYSASWIRPFLKCPSLHVLYQPAYNTIITEPFHIAWHLVNVLLYFAIKSPKLLYISWSFGSPYIVEEEKRILTTGFDCRQKPLCDANAVCTTDPVNRDHHVCVCNSGFQGNGSLCHGKRKISPFQT